MIRRYSIVLTPEPDGSVFNVISPDIPNLVTFGTSHEEALAMALDFAEALILVDLDDGREIPDEGGASEVASIEVNIEALRAKIAAEKVAVPV